MSQRLFQKRLFPIVSLLLLLLFFLCSTWWYGYYPELGKTIRSLEESKAYGLLLSERENPNTITDDLFYDTFEQEIPQMTTEVLAKIYTLNHIYSFLIYDPYYGATGYDDFRSLYPSKSMEEIEEDKDYPTLIVYSLFERNNAARVLMKVYEETPITFTDEYGRTGNVGCIAYLEKILVQEEIQRHLSPLGKNDLRKLADQKQVEKFLEPIYPLHDAIYNYLYTDTCGYRNQDIYGEDYKEDFGWLDEKVEERAKPFMHLRDTILTAKDTAGWENLSLKERAQQIKDPQKRRDVLDLLEKMWPADTRAENWKRFDDCQITQP